MGLALDRIASALISAKRICHPVLDVDLVRQPRDGCTLCIVRVQEIVLQVGQSPERKPLQVERIARGPQELGFEGIDVSR